MSDLTTAVGLGTRAIVLRSVKYDGSLNYSWPAHLLWEDESGFIWYTPAGATLTRPTGGQPVPYDWVGRVWYARWYLVDASLVTARDAGTAGVVHHYYCNLGLPGAWQTDEYRFVDLDLDVLIYPDGRHAVLDEDEFTMHQERFGYPTATVAGVRQAAQDVLALARSGTEPFDGTLARYHVALHAE
jgi:protein associated with RNAse G/E